MVHYEALGPVQFMRVVHIFFPFNGSYVPLGGSSRINVQAGTIKTSFEIAMWPFQSSSNSLLLTLTAKTNSPITELRRSAASINNETEFAIKTESLTLNFGVLNLAVYDSLTTVRSISFNASTIESGVAFKFLFSSFDTWMATILNCLSFSGVRDQAVMDLLTQLSSLASVSDLAGQLLLQSF